MKENDVIAIIIILLFIVLALIAFGIYRLVHMARAQGTVSSEESGTGSAITDEFGSFTAPSIYLPMGGRTSASCPEPFPAAVESSHADRSLLR
ncbi:hypothetical protein F5Y11DRAFT_347328 [Daldinia sp. FL1419]|nr:hypothetical protein F5Y11DRAFT_347328 [Daldinia sp. FL1419]